MTDLTENFKEISKLTVATSIKIDEKKLTDPDKIDLWRMWNQGLAAERQAQVDQQAKDRALNIAGYANENLVQPTLTPAPTRKTPVMKAEVEAMMRRSEEDNVPLEDLTPENEHEIRIIGAFKRNRQREEREREELELKLMQLSRHHLDELLTLSVAQIRGGHDQGSKTRSLTDEFSRVR